MKISFETCVKNSINSSNFEAKDESRFDGVNKVVSYESRASNSNKQWQ